MLMFFDLPMPKVEWKGDPLMFKPVAVTRVLSSRHAGARPPCHTMTLRSLGLQRTCPWDDVAGHREGTACIVDRERTLGLCHGGRRLERNIPPLEQGHYAGVPNPLQ